MTSDLDQSLSDEDDDEGLDAPASPARRSRRIGQADVFGAADELLLEGNRPTIDRVRMRLGRGSPNTINEHLDAWWLKLGARLRDIPGREFPDLPDPVANALQSLWNVAIDSAHAALDGRAVDRETALAEREAALEGRESQIAEQERLSMVRSVALEDSLTLAREQLTATQQRADRLEVALQAREAECDRGRQRVDVVEQELREVRVRFDATAAAYQVERKKQDERHAASEARWLVEVDRCRQTIKEGSKEHERLAKEFRSRIGQLQARCDELKRELDVARAQIRTAIKDKAQLEKRLTTLSARATTSPPRTKSKSGIAAANVPNQSQPKEPSNRGRRR